MQNIKTISYLVIGLDTENVAFSRTGFWSIVMKMMYLYLHLHVLELIATCLIYKD